MVKTIGKNWAMHHEFGSDNSVTMILSAQWLEPVCDVPHIVVVHSQRVSCCHYLFSTCIMLLLLILNMSHLVVVHSQRVSCCCQEIEKAWKMVDAAHEKETRAKETIQSLKMEISNLSKLVETGAGLSVGQEHR